VPRSAALIGALLAALAVLLGAGQLGSGVRLAGSLAGTGSSATSSLLPSLPATPLPLRCADSGLMPDHNSSLVFLDPWRGWMRGRACLDGMWRAVLATTNDGGETWQAIGSPDLPGGTLRFASPSDGWLLGERVLTTHDGGATWTEEPLLRNVQTLEVVGPTCGRSRAPALSLVHAIINCSFRPTWDIPGGLRRSSR
jgi:hypothetical protein